MKDIVELVPLEKLNSEENFFEYLKQSNEDIGTKQVVGLKKIAAYAEDKTLFETRQGIMREKCLQYWKIPDKGRTVPRYMDPARKAENLLKCTGSDFTNIISFEDKTKLTKENIYLNVLRLVTPDLRFLFSFLSR